VKLALTQGRGGERTPSAAPTSMSVLEVGDELSASLGPETFAPIAYNTFTVGPVRASTKVREGETGEQAWLRLHRFCEELFQAEFEISSLRYIEHLKELRVLVDKHKVTQ
jgi:hypothetical protein